MLSEIARVAGLVTVVVVLMNTYCYRHHLHRNHHHHHHQYQHTFSRLSSSSRRAGITSGHGQQLNHTVAAAHAPPHGVGQPINAQP